MTTPIRHLSDQKNDHNERPHLFYHRTLYPVRDVRAVKPYQNPFTKSFICMANETGGGMPRRVFSACSPATNCHVHLAQDVLLNFAAIAPALPSSSRRFPCRWRLLFMAFSPRCHRVRAGSQGTRPRHCGAAPCPWSQEEAAGDEAQGRHHHQQHVPARERSFVRAALH